LVPNPNPSSFKIMTLYMAKNLLVDLLNYQVTTDTLENLMLDFLVLYTDGTDLVPLHLYS